ncbi:hypothetical protein FHS31_002657 [Sphingomonas vulcanisoli]|uniref:GmrSD restriction endonucleases N-terminal domain-containing protein n=1 Tax=Sphingomonas vulcanisoli TaxID=1658060 RepID=A0ABX0TX64_9SPHN|nr:DUF262 domain-containing protein [Sphingomonas vulcanisoli]NIJ09027.1 hypothetical protein [Sphingomonas vulcanisoli]
MADTETDELEVDDVSEDAETHIEYDIATYPSDLTLSVIHEMWKNDEIIVPSFQRNFVWNIKQSSNLIESFLVGLPVPQVFFYISEKNKNLVIDGQQRIKSVIFFLEGYFGEENLQGRRQVFRLFGLDEKSPYYNKRFVDLTESDQRKLKSAVLRAVNIRQLAPNDQSTSMYHIFERLNTGGTPLKPQEIRNCVFHGSLVETLHTLNDNTDWRKIIDKRMLDKYQKDVELILRIFAMAERGQKYEKPMKEFLSKQMELHRSAGDPVTKEFVKNFVGVCTIITKKLPSRPFHIRGPLNLAALDSVFATLIKYHAKIPHDIGDRLGALVKNKKYQEAIFFNTSDASTVEVRLNLAKQILID